MSFRGAERTAKEVHSTLCAMVTAQAATFSAWAAYETVLVDPETAAFFASRLSAAEAAEHSDGESKPPSKKKKKRKRKLRDDGSGSDEEADDDDSVAVVCEHCGGAVPEVSLRVACLDGTSLDVTVAQRGLVREVKRLVGQVRVVASSAQRWFVFVLASASTHSAASRLQMRDMDPGLIELFVDGEEDGLPGSGRLDVLGLGSGSVVFMLHRLGWRWDECGSKIALSGEGLVFRIVFYIQPRWV